MRKRAWALLGTWPGNGFGVGVSLCGSGLSPYWQVRVLHGACDWRPVLIPLRIRSISTLRLTAASCRNASTCLNPFMGQVHFHAMALWLSATVRSICLNPFESQVYFHDSEHPEELRQHVSRVLIPLESGLFLQRLRKILVWCGFAVAFSRTSGGFAGIRCSLSDIYVYSVDIKNKNSCATFWGSEK